MYKPKFTPPRRLPLLTLLTVAVTLSSLAGSTLALLSQTTPTLSNTFSLAAGPAPEIEEVFNGTVKENVSVRNTGDIPCYLRAAVIITMRDEQGDTQASLPQPGQDYVLEYNPDSGWFSGADGFWYYPNPVAPGESTPPLLSRCTSLNGCALDVTIVSQAIQSRPESAVSSVWGVRTSGGVLVPGGEAAS